MNLLETIGLITVVGVGGYFLSDYLQVEAAKKKRQEDIKWRAFYVSHRLGLRHCFQQNPDKKIKEELSELAENYGGISTIALNLNDSEYEELIRKDYEGGDVFQKAQSWIRANGYPLAIEAGNVINRWRGIQQKVMAS